MLRSDNPLLDAVFYYPQPEAGYLRISGQDRAAFLQRQTTNDIKLLAPGRSILTVLTTPAARILDLLRLLEEKEVIGAIPLPGYAKETLAYLKSRIFFMDKVAVDDASTEYIQIDLEGSQAANLLTHLNFPKAPEQDEVLAGELDGKPVLAVGQPGLSGLGFRMLFPAQAEQQVESTLVGAGAERLTPEQYQILRIEAGLPAARAELTEEFTPLEAGLEAAVSDRKGCYTGQEVIARQLTYDKVTQHLAGLHLDSPVNEGVRIWADGRMAGRITSFALSPTYGPIALGIIKRPHHEPGTRVEVGGEEDRISAVVASLPFKDPD